MEELHHEHIPGHAPEKKQLKKGKVPPPPPKDSAIDEGLQAIYGDDRSDLQVVEREKRSATKILSRIVIALAALAILAYGGFFLYTTFFATPKDDKPLVMGIQAPQEIKSGEPVTLTFTYQNPRRVPIASLELDVNLPTAFELTKATPAPTNEEDFLWTIGSLGPQSDGQIVLEGVWRTAVPASTTIQVLAHYRPANFNADFSDIATASVTTLASTASLEIKGPDKAMPGQPVTFEGVITNTGKAVLPSPGFILTLPEGFILTTSTPALASGEEPKWELPDIAPGESSTVSWTGSFASNASDVAQFSGQVVHTTEDLELLQTSADWFVDVAGSDINVTVVANGTSDDATTSVGDVLRLTARLENAGKEDLTDASLLIDFQPGSGIPIVWSGANLDGGKLAADGIHFSSTVIGTIKAGEKKSFNLSFPVSDTPAATDLDTWTIAAFATHGAVTIQTTPITIRLNAEPKLSAEARYFSTSSAPLGEGPLPPTVGKTTTYRLFWSIEPSIHDLEKIEVRATLPPGITWSDSVTSSHGSVSYDESSRTVRWQIDVLPANEKSTAEFSLAVLPGPEDVDTFMKILSASALSGKDSTTDISLSAESPELTTELPTDTYAAGQGLVIDEQPVQ